MRNAEGRGEFWGLGGDKRSQALNRLPFHLTPAPLGLRRPANCFKPYLMQPHDTNPPSVPVTKHTDAATSNPWVTDRLSSGEIESLRQQNREDTIRVQELARERLAAGDYPGKWRAECSGSEVQ